MLEAGDERVCGFSWVWSFAGLVLGDLHGATARMIAGSDHVNGCAVESTPDKG